MLLKYLVFLAMLLFCPALAAAAQPYDRSKAVIFSYNSVGDDLSSAATIGADLFEAHIQELIDGSYTVISLPDAVKALQHNKTLPQDSIVITFDGGRKSALRTAIPLLLKHNLPFTVFFSPNQADGNTIDYMSWQDLERLSRQEGVTLGLHPDSYMRVGNLRDHEIRRHLNNSIAAYDTRFGTRPLFFSYPFGDLTRPYRNIVEESGFIAAFGQQSGAAYPGSDLYLLPRFVMTDNYGSSDRFRMAATSLPLPVTDITPDDYRVEKSSAPVFGFTIDNSLTSRIDQVSCFFSGHGKADIQVVGTNRIELRGNPTFLEERIRLNCTMPGPESEPGEEQRWRWFGMLLTNGSPDDAREGDLQFDTEPLPN